MGRKGRGATSEDLLESLVVDLIPQWRAHHDSVEVLDVSVTALHDWRAAVRENALTAIAGALEELPLLAEVDTRCYIVFALCGISINKGPGSSSSCREARLAYRAVGLLAHASIRRALVPRAGVPAPPQEAPGPQSVSHRDEAPALAAALDCLAAVTFAGAMDTQDVDRSIQAIWAVIAHPVSKKTTKAILSSSQSQVVAAAVSAWTFLITTTTDALPRRKAASAAATVATLARLLDSEDRAVRMAAGEALAVCVELNLTQHTPRKDMDAMQARVSELAYEANGRGANNTLLLEQKHLFRQVAAFLDRDERPRESVTMRGRRGCVVALKVSTWAKLVQLNFLRRFLGGGFLKHTHGNKLLNDAFSCGAGEEKVLSMKKRRGNVEDNKFLEVEQDWLWLCTYLYPTKRYRGRDISDKLLQRGWH